MDTPLSILESALRNEIRWPSSSVDTQKRDSVRIEISYPITYGAG